MNDKKDEIEIVDAEEPVEVEVWQPGKKPISFLRCKTCYLRKECPCYDPDKDDCVIKEMEEVDTTTGEGIIALVQQMLKIQAERVLRAVKIEEVEGGLIEPAVTQEILTFFSLVEKLKRLLSDDDYLVIRSKGRASQGILQRLFGDLGG